MKINLVLFLIPLLCSSCVTTAPKDDIEVHFGDLPKNPFEISKDKKENI